MMNRRVWAAWLSLAAGLLWISAAPGGTQASGAEEPATSTGPAARVPLDKVPEAMRERVRQVVEQPTLVTHGPLEVFTAQPAWYYWFLDHPEQATRVWRRLGAQCLDIKRQSDGRFTWTEA